MLGLVESDDVIGEDDLITIIMQHVSEERDDIQLELDYLTSISGFQDLTDLLSCLVSQSID